MATPCPREFTSKDGATGPHNISIVREWIQWALKQPSGQRRIFLNEELDVSTKTCYNITQETEWGMPPTWFLLDAGDNGPRSDTFAQQAAKLKLHLAVRQNVDSFDFLTRPKCVRYFGDYLWDHGLFPLPYTQLDRPSQVQHESQVVYVVTDAWNNAAHTFHMWYWLDGALRHGKLLDTSAKVVMSAVALFDWVVPLGCAVLEGLSTYGWKVPLESNQPLERCQQNYRRGDLSKLNLRGPIKCYDVVVQRALHGPGRPIDDPNLLWRSRALNFCKLPEDKMRMKRKMILHFKKGNRELWPLRRAVKLLESWATLHDLEFIATSLNSTETSAMTKCDHVSMFGDAAIYMDVFGAGGVYGVLLPPGALMMDVFYDDPAMPRGGNGYWSSPTTLLAGALHFLYNRGVPFGEPPTDLAFPKWIWIDWINEVLPTLDIIYHQHLYQYLPPPQVQ
eukprot:TRINITY_DN798_c1_g1_i1.p1 TRINITY_DN798_c1_g1~~TRINITY_DN798_c1_g1_i1.p1  ORF type:complete len:449 (-),score=31.51 TRINITY_DN798_c1_g1_i1:42-1388(-)